MRDINLHGIIPAIVTPMTAAGGLDLPALKRYVSWLVDQGPVALAVPGVFSRLRLRRIGLGEVIVIAIRVVILEDMRSAIHARTE